MQIPPSVIEAINNGAVGILPTDTIYGVVASINFPDAIQRIYQAKGRPKDKRLIYLISDVSQLKILGIEINEVQKKKLDELWPGPISVALKCDDTVPYMHAGMYSIASRMPEPEWLRKLIDQTGPLGTTSANIAGEPYVPDMKVIKKVLPDLDYYVEGLSGPTPSRLGTVHKDGSLEWISRGPMR